MEKYEKVNTNLCLEIELGSNNNEMHNKIISLVLAFKFYF